MAKSIIGNWGECSYRNLQPQMISFLNDRLGGQSEDIVLCYHGLFGLTYKAIVITKTIIVTASMFIRGKEYSDKNSKIQQLEDFYSISESESGWSKSYYITCRSREGTVLLILEFGRKDELAEKVYRLLNTVIFNKGEESFPNTEGADERLKKIKRLFDQGIITEEEYQQKRKKIIEDI